MEEYEVNLVIKADPESNFFDSDRDANVQNLLELIRDTLYDIDDIKVTYIEVEQR